MREIFKELTKLIKDHEKVIIMTHKNMDFDGLGSSLCLYSIIKTFKKECYICLNRRGLNKSIKKALEQLEKERISPNFIFKSKIKDIDKKDTLLVILDTYKKNMLESKEALKHIKNVIVIDHHVVNKIDINDTKLTYINEDVSSVVEIMVNYLKYLNKKVEPLIATIMLAGIEIDTNGFKVKTTEETYNSAAHLTTLGADNIVKQEILQESKEEYLQRQKFIKDSYTIKDNISLCVLDGNIYDKEDLAALAENLLQFEDIEASFVIGKIAKNIVGISARSVGTIDVFKVCKTFGGGGHITTAAAQIKNKNISDVKGKLLKILK